MVVDNDCVFFFFFSTLVVMIMKFMMTSCQSMS